LAVMRDLGYSIPNIALTSTAGADTIRVGTGHYTVDGGAGIDTLVVPATSSGYTVTTSSVSSGSNQFDLANVERVQFTDKNLALDVGPTGSAGQAVELIGAVLGTGMLANPSVVGIAIGLFDSGQTMQQIAQLCIDRGLLPADNAGLVGKLWLDVVGSSIDAGNLANFTGLLQGSGGTMAAADLVVLAATNTVNLQHVGLVGLASTAIAYS
jgi:serralysin